MQAGQEEYDRLRPMSYPNTNVLIICYSIDSRNSFQNINQRWLPEIKHFCPNIPFVIAATKVDLRDSEDALKKLENEGKTIISKDEGVAFVKKVKGAKYCECSALQNKGVTDLFDDAVRVTKDNGGKKGGKKGCLLL